MYCPSCVGTFLAWDDRIMCQLTDGHRARFPIVLTRKYACDQSVVSLLRSRDHGKQSLCTTEQYKGASQSGMAA
jgi:hypothetical protein